MVRSRLACAVVVSLGLTAVMAVLARPARADRIADIVVEDNTKSTPETVILIADIEVGDDWDGAVAERVKLDLVSSGLFKDVNVWWDNIPGGVRVHLVAKDKHSWVIAPAFYNQPTNKGGGIGFGENNLFGENEKLLLYGQIATGDSFFIGAYIDPSIAGTRFHWQYDVWLKTGRIIEYAPPREWRDDPEPLRESRLNYLNQGLKVGLSLWKALSLDFRGRGAWVSYSRWGPVKGATAAEITGDPEATETPRPGGEGWDVSGIVELGIDTRANWYGLSQGHRFLLSYERSAPGMGSDFNYSLMQFRIERHRRYFERHNLILKASAALGRNLPFQQELQTGGTAMRGWKNGQFRGDTRVTANVEYSVPFFTIYGVSIRGLAFWDSAYTTFTSSDERAAHRDYLPGSEARGLAPFKNSVGLGTRLFMRQIVLPLLGLDFGYGLERGDYEIYLAIGLTD
jgi:outer membrane protein insertion porin family